MRKRMAPRCAEEAAASLIAEARQAAVKSEEERDLLAQKIVSSEQERERLAGKVADLEKARLAPIIRALGALWRADAVTCRREPRGIDDPVYGRVFLNEQLSTILAHPLVQRLSRIRQLSFSYAQFPSARHSRLSHVLGVVRNAELAVAGMLERGDYYVAGEDRPRRLPDEILQQKKNLIEKAKVVALLHDVGHGPFGHALDNYAGVLLGIRPDKEYTARYIREALAPTLKSLGLDPKELICILGSDREALQGMNHLIADVVDSSLDVDRMDYLVRDAHMTGLMMGFTNTMALIDCMRPVFDEASQSFILAYHHLAIGYMEHLLLARDMMFLNCYEHPRKKAAERIFIRLVKSMVEDPALGLDLDDLFALTDEEITAVLRGVGCGSEIRFHLLEELMGDLDYTVAHELPASRRPDDPPPPPPVKMWVECVAMGLPTQLQLAYIAQPEIWERAIAEASIGIDRVWQIQVVLPDPGVYLPQHSATRLLTQENGKYKAVSFFDKSRRVKEILEHMNYERQRIAVMCPATLDAGERDSIKLASAKILESPKARQG